MARACAFGARRSDFCPYYCHVVPMEHCVQFLDGPWIFFTVCYIAVNSEICCIFPCKHSCFSNCLIQQIESLESLEMTHHVASSYTSLEPLITKPLDCGRNLLTWQQVPSQFWLRILSPAGAHQIYQKKSTPRDYVPLAVSFSFSISEFTKGDICCWLVIERSSQLFQELGSSTKKYLLRYQDNK